MTDKAATKEPDITQETLYTWESPSRLYKKRNKEYYKTIGVILFLFVVILVFAQEFLLIFALLSVVFFMYVLSTVPPENVKHKITNLGVETDNNYYRYEQLSEFWFEEQWEQTMCVFRQAIGARIVVLIHKKDKETIRNMLVKHLPFREEPKKSWVDNASKWLTETIPLENKAA